MLISELEKMAADYLAEQESVKKELEKVNAELDAVEGKRQAALKAGRFDVIKEKLRAELAQLQYDKADLEEYLLEREAYDIKGKFTNEDVREAWSAAVKEYNKKAEKDIAAFRKHRKELAQEYLNIAASRSELNTLRDRATQLLTKQGKSETGRPLGFAPPLGFEEPREELDISSDITAVGNYDIESVYRTFYSFGGSFDPARITVKKQ